MKTERRHELQTNQLADWLGHQIEKIQPYFKAIGGVAAALVVLALVYAFMHQREYHQAGLVWGEYLGALREREQDDQVALLARVADQNQNSPAGLWAAQTEADIDLERGARLLFTDREDALKTLERAQKNFEKVAQEARRNPILLERARFGAAQAYECQGMLQKAKEAYEQVATTNPKGALGKMAAQRAEAISDKSIADFYGWFEKQKPAPIRRPGALGMPGGAPPFKLDDQPDRPDFDLPGLGGAPGATPTKPTDESKDAVPAEKTEKSSDTPEDKPSEPAGDKPAPEKPAEEKPAADKPAEEKPAEEKPAAEKPANP